MREGERTNGHPIRRTLLQQAPSLVLSLPHSFGHSLFPSAFLQEFLNFGPFAGIATLAELHKQNGRCPCTKPKTTLIKVLAKHAPRGWQMCGFDIDNGGKGGR